jgi:hypothetical protein
LIAGDPSLAGKQVTCPHCGKVLTMPEARSAPKKALPLARQASEPPPVPPILTSEEDTPQWVDCPVAGTKVVVHIDKALLETLSFERFSLVARRRSDSVYIASTMKNRGSCMLCGSMLATSFLGEGGVKLCRRFYMDARLQPGEVTHLEASCYATLFGIDPFWLLLFGVVVGGPLTCGLTAILCFFWLLRIDLFFKAMIGFGFRFNVQVDEKRLTDVFIAQTSE